MDLERPILLLVKKSFYELYGVERKDPRFLAMMSASTEAAQELLEAHRENIAAIEAVERYLAQRGIPYHKSEGTQGKVDDRFSLVVAVGGDGTLLAAAHQVLTTRVVGINSRPGRSVGYFCAADSSGFEALLDDVVSGRRKPRKLSRMDLFVNGYRKSPPALNDILYAATSPAATTRYLLCSGGHEELHRGSGVWVATPAGSTAAIGAAGGEAMDLEAPTLQFFVREPYVARDQSIKIRGGIFEDGLAITNLTPEAAVYLDGTRHSFAIHYGDVIEPRLSSHPLCIYL